MDTADMVREAGFEVVEASSADEALVFLLEGGPILFLLTDIEMPGRMDGIDLAQYAAEHFPGICIVVSSGAVEPIESALPSCTKFVAKPLNLASIQAAVRDFAKSNGHLPR